MKRKKSNSKKRLLIFFILGLILAGIFFISFPFVFYLKILPNIVANPNFVKYTSEFVQEKTGAVLTLKSPVLKTSLTPIVELNAKEFSLSKNNKYILSIKNFESKTTFIRVFKHKISLLRVGADYLFVDVNKLQAILPKTQKQKKSDWTLNWLDSILYLNKCEILYGNSTTKIRVRGKDFYITSSRHPKKVHFKLKIDVKQKGLPPVKIGLWDNNKVYIQHHKIYFDKFLFFINRSPIFVSAIADDNKHFDIKVSSDKFDLKNVVELINSNLLVKNGREMLSVIKDIDGQFRFNFHFSNKVLNAKISLINGKFKIPMVKNLPVVLNSGNIFVNKKDIYFNNFSGYYASLKKANRFEVKGGAKNYLKTVNVIAYGRGLLTNDFMKNYLTPMVGYPITLNGDALSFVKINADSKKMDIRAFSKIKKQDNILIAGASITPKGWERALSADMHFENNLLNIKNINYYISQEISKRTKGKNPVVVNIKGLVDCKNMKVLKMGFSMPHALPSEFMNLFLGQNFFKKGTVVGHMMFINTAKIPTLEGQIKLLKVRVPSQRLKIREGEIATDKKHIHVLAKGRYRKSGYKLDAEIKNVVVFPVVVKDANLVVEKLDVEKVLKTFNSDTNVSLATPQNSQSPAETEKIIMSYTDNEKDSDANVYTFPPNLLVVEKCMLHVINGKYKGILFGNMHSDLTLNKKGILQVQSNKFDFANGGASCKIYCDLMKHKYSILIAARQVDSDIIATNLLELKKEITGRASTIIKLYTDDSLKMNGSIDFSIRNGSIAKLGVIEYILKVAALFRNPLAMISPITFWDLANMPEGTFDRIIGTMVINDNIVHKINIKSASPQLSSFIAGRFNLETRDASLRIYTKFSNQGKGFAGFLRRFSLNTLAHRGSLSTQNLANYYSSEIEKIPTLKYGEKTAQVFLTTVEGDIEHNNFLSSLKRIK